MSDIILTIDGKKITAAEGDTILLAAEKNGIEIPNLCYLKEMSPYGACGMCVVEMEGSPKLLRACSQKVSEGLVINTMGERALKARKIALELIMGDHKGDCIGPCSLNCPAHTDCQKYVKEIAEGDNEAAVRTIKEVISLPASIGRVCPHPCETACRRQYVEEPISIAYLKAFAADEVLKSGNHVLPEIKKPSGKSVGIIGGGPAGLSAAYKLAQEGHKVTIYDKMPKMGGMLRYGIPEYRLPKAVLDAEIEEIKSLGVEMINGCTLGKDITLSEIREKHDAVLVANGAWKSSSIRCPGEDLDGVFGGIDFLRAASLGENPEIGKKTAIVGGGNTAMDACRTAVRLGAEEVSIIYRRTRDEMPAEDVEIEEAMEEGVIFRFLTNPAEIIGENGKVKAVKLQVMKLGEPDEKGRRSPVPVEGEFITLELDSIIIAAGQKNDSFGFEELETTKRGTILADERTYR
ncbi:MAG: FAD-dependent oxidoreductase, partial [Clostridia bacterium]|nr:FAD-dependent oxidoreductase [Clostridia bacterium]